MNENIIRTISSEMNRLELMLQKLGKELGEEKVHPHKFRKHLQLKQ